jgi:hypothetical protein
VAARYRSAQVQGLPLRASALELPTLCIVIYSINSRKGEFAMRTTTQVFALIFSLLAASIASGQTKQWVHVRIENPEKAERVRMNIPLSVVEAMLPLIKDKNVHAGQIRLNEKDVRVDDLRRVWNEIRKQGDTEFVNIENRETSLRVFTKGSYLLVQPDKPTAKKIDIRIPLSVVDAMFSGKADELNLMAAVQALKQLGSREIITVESDDSLVQVWIDEKNQVK